MSVAERSAKTCLGAALPATELECTGRKSDSVLAAPWLHHIIHITVEPVGFYLPLVFFLRPWGFLNRTSAYFLRPKWVLGRSNPVFPL